MGNKIDNEGLKVQKDVDEKLGHTYERNTNQNEEKTHESFISLDWVNNLEDIKPFIDEAYRMRD
ncbi:hypothetical protein ACFFIS_06545 [Virgibacillus soli]|uniref:hypothetical protein n=1 Tax=Paracerasibacillus soli TaxID=480284 RepID=UPI0035EEB7E5